MPKPILTTAALLLAAATLSAQEPPAPIGYAEFKQRRQALMQRLEKGIVVLAGHDKIGAGLNGQIQKEDFFYLTGIRQQNAALILFPETGKDLLLVEPYSRFTARWDGQRIVPSEKHEELTKFDAIEALPALQRTVGEWLEAQTKSDPETQPTCWVETKRMPRSRGIERPQSYETALKESLAKQHPKLRFRSVTRHIRNLRGVKSKEEIRCLTAATRIACAGIAEAMKSTVPGVYEFQIAAAARYVFHRMGAEEDGYAAIVGAGLNGCILHYKHNTKKTLPNELVVMDYAPKVHGYSSDVTRTFPTSGKFTPEQRKLVQDVHDVQQILIAMVQPGARLSQISSRCSRELRKRGYVSRHGPSHHVGLNVHDEGGDLLKPGMLITVEPGAYLPEKKMGCRIEDVILVTKDGHVNLSGHLPSLPADIEKLMASRGVQQVSVGTLPPQAEPKKIK